MKYLRLFEGFGDEYYVEISLDDADGYSKNRVNLTNREIVWLTDNLKVDEWYRSNGIRDNRDISIGVSSNGFRSVPTSKFRYIYKIEDDYFICSLNEEGITYYKCDQWEGFIKLLTDKNVI
jgi:hypothetical protein